MKLKALNTVKCGGVYYRSGSPFDCPDEDAPRLLVLGAAHYCIESSDLDLGRESSDPETVDFDPDSMKKPEIVSALQEMEVDFDPTKNKPELLSLLKAELAKG